MLTALSRLFLPPIRPSLIYIRFVADYVRLLTSPRLYQANKGQTVLPSPFLPHHKPFITCNAQQPSARTNKFLPRANSSRLSRKLVHHHFRASQVHTISQAFTSSPPRLSYILVLPLGSIRLTLPVSSSRQTSSSSLPSISDHAASGRL